MEKYLIHGKGIYDPVSGRYCANGLLVSIGNSDQGVGRILERGEFKKLKAHYPECYVMDLKELWILPGLINTHVHLEFNPEGDTFSVYRKENSKKHIDRAIQAARKLLRSGVTGVRDAGSSMELICALKDRGDIPSIQFCGPPLTLPRGHLYFLGGEVQTETEIQNAVQRRAKAGCGCVKLIASGGRLTPGSKPEQDTYTKEQMYMAVKEAHKLGLKIAAHCLTGTSAVHAIQAGVDSIEHAACFKNVSGCLMRVWEPELWSGLDKTKIKNVFLMPGISNTWDPNVAKCLQAEIACRLKAMGMLLTVGTDAGCQNTFFEETWKEIWLLTEVCKLTEAEALYTATIQSAQALGWEDVGGTSQGYRADLIAAREDPLKDIRVLRNVEHTFLGGKMVF